MDEIISVLARQHGELGGILASFVERDWTRPTRCEGWTTSDVVLHLAQTDELARASAEVRYAEASAEAGAGLPPTESVDDLVELMVARERGQPGSDVRDRWEGGAGQLRDALAECDPRQRVPWIAGTLSARTLATTRLAETWIHTGDVAAAVDVELELDDRLLAHRTPGVADVALRLRARRLGAARARRPRVGGAWGDVAVRSRRDPLDDDPWRSFRSVPGRGAPPGT